MLPKTLALILALLTISPAHGASRNPAAPYCLALRGNGEAEPAHWGALAQVVEHLGLPKAMAGGSSASISLFFLESIAANSQVRKASPEEAKMRASFLLKSLQSYLEVIVNRKEWRDVMSTIAYLRQQIGSGPQADWLKRLDTDPEIIMELVEKNFGDIRAAFQSAVEVGLIDVAAIRPLLVAIAQVKNAPSAEARTKAARQVQFFAGELHQSASVIGKFNAQTDTNLFFRPALVNFDILARSFGKIGNFLSGREFTPAMTRSLENLFSTCARPAMNQTWDQLKITHPECESAVKELIVSYHGSGLPLHSPSREQDLVGGVIPAFPGTAVITGPSVTKTLDELAAYPLAMDPKFGDRFQVKGDDVLFGYWGPQEGLSRIDVNRRRLFGDDAKSGRFYSLGETNWRQVLRLSPAEPGLAPLQPFQANGEKLISAGGWSDLHPVALLKSYGCEQVVYVTRRGGESFFVQGVAKRLFGFDEAPHPVSWERLDSAKQENVVLNNTGLASDKVTLWSRLYNLANRQSSFNRALELADAVVCTDWNSFKVTNSHGVSDLINDSYTAPWAFRQLETKLGQQALAWGSKIVTPQENAGQPFPPYAGCLPIAKD